MARYYSPSKRDYVEVYNPYDEYDAKPVDILLALSPAHKRLNDLDKWEKAANHQKNLRVINYQKWQDTIEVICLARIKAGIALDKERGIYKSPSVIAREAAKIAKEQLEFNTLSSAIELAKKEKFLKECKHLAIWGIAVLGLILACIYPELSVFYILAFMYFVSKR